MTIRFKLPRKWVGFFVCSGLVILAVTLHATAPAFIALTTAYGTFAATHAYSDKRSDDKPEGA